MWCLIVCSLFFFVNAINGLFNPFCVLYTLYVCMYIDQQCRYIPISVTFEHTRTKSKQKQKEKHSHTNTYACTSLDNTLKSKRVSRSMCVCSAHPLRIRHPTNEREPMNRAAAHKAHTKHKQ